MSKRKQQQQQKRTKRWRDMTTAELAEATSEYDREMVEVPSVPVPPELKVRHDRVMKRLRGRPRVGQGSERVVITVERGLLGAADDFARARGMSRSQMIAAGLRMMMGSGLPGAAVSGAPAATPPLARRRSWSKVRASNGGELRKK